MPYFTNRGITPLPAVVVGFGCVGTAGLHSANPNDLTQTADWTPGTNLNVPGSGASDPLGGSTGTQLVATITGGSNQSGIGNSVATTFTLNSGTTYTFGAYLRPFAGPTWVIVQTSDSTANAFGSWFDISGLTVGSPNVAGTGSLTCTQIAASTNGYARVSIGGNVSSTNASMRFFIILVNGDNITTATAAQEVHVWQVCP